MAFLLELAKGSESRILGGFSRTRWERVEWAFDLVARDPVERSLLAGIAWTESDFVPTAINESSGTVGLMQIHPVHFDRLGASWRWQDPAQNVEAGKDILLRHGLGRDPLMKVLADYGGFVKNDPRQYVQKVLYRSAFMFLRG